MFEAVSNAKKYIYLEMYIFQNDMKDFDFFYILKEKAKQGLRIRIILDSLGSRNLSNNSISELKEAGAEILTMSYLLHRMHRKVLVVDDNVAFIGGVNFHQIASRWNDLMVRIKGKLVKKVSTSFTKSYINAGGKDPVLLNNNDVNTVEETNLGIVDHSPVIKKFRFKKIYKKYLTHAEKSITLVTPYFMPKRWLSAALHQAVLRGVNVEILVPRSSDHFFINRVNYFYIYKLSKLGIKFYMEEKMNHAKAMVIDENEGMVGSQNLDLFSFELNSEIGVFFKDTRAVLELLKITQEWKKDSVLFDYKTYKPKWFDYILSPVINLFNLFLRIF